MRTHSNSNITVEYPDLVGFCYNPVVVNVQGSAVKRVRATITDNISGKSEYEDRETFGTRCFFDLSYYAMSFYDTEYRNVDYSKKGAENSQLGRPFSVSLDMYNSSDGLVDSFSFNVFVVWGHSRVGERFNGDRVLTWFKNFPFSVGMYSAASGSVQVHADGSEQTPISLSGQNLWNIIPTGIEAHNNVEFYLPGSTTAASVFDHTFDFTFRGLMNKAVRITCKVDDSTDGVYLRWINRHGMWCYYLFCAGDETSKVSNDGEFIRNNMQDYSFKDGYHGGTGRKQRKSEETTISICAPLVDSETFDFLYQLTTSPIVDLFMGYDEGGKAKWVAVNVALGTFTKSKRHLQDFECAIMLPETNLQSL